MDNMISSKPKTPKWLWIILIVVIVIAIAFFGFYFRDKLRTLIFGESGSPVKVMENLIGPTNNNRAKVLDPVKIVYWTNFYREQYGLKDLTKNEILTKAAQEKNDDMLKNQYFEHVSPSGVSPSDLVTSVGYNYKTTGQNLALGDFTSEKDLVDAWMNSPGHRANILNKDYTEIGVGTESGKFQDRPITWLATQEFGKPMPNCAKPDQNTLNDINSKKTELDGLNNQIKNLPAGTTAAQAQALSDQAQALANTINSESSSYNAAVDKYNACISG